MRGAPWVTCPEIGPALEQLAAACRASPLAAVALAQLMRLSAGAPGERRPGGRVLRLLDAPGRSGAPEVAGPSDHPTGGPGGGGAGGGHAGRWNPDHPTRPAHGCTTPTTRPCGTGWSTPWQVAAWDPSVRAVELIGSGPSFCSGGDLVEFGTAPDPATAHAVRVERGAARWMHRCSDRTTVRVHGACIGAGVELASFARRVVAHPDTYFQLPEVAMGLVPGAGGTAGLPRRDRAPAHHPPGPHRRHARRQNRPGVGSRRRDRRPRPAPAPVGNRRFGVTSPTVRRALRAGAGHPPRWERASRARRPDPGTRTVDRRGSAWSVHRRLDAGAGHRGPYREPSGSPRRADARAPVCHERREGPWS